MIGALLWAPTASPLGGHRVQLVKTAEGLNRQGDVRARVSHDPQPSFDGLDLVHGFGLDLTQVRMARRAGLPVALSTIYWSKGYRLGVTQHRTRAQELGWRVRAAGVLGRAALQGEHYRKAEAYVEWVTRTTALYESADLLLPNSVAEAEDLVADLAVTTPWLVVPNAVDPALFSDPGPAGRAGVLMVARMEPHKNQLGLIRALKGSGMHLTLAGAPHPDHPGYVSTCRAEADPAQVTILGRVSDEQLPGLYTAALVHALPSFFESTGLVSLEASLSGCAVVTTDRGYARDYFGGLAEYCDPSDDASIAGAVQRAATQGAPAALAGHVLDSYTWAHAAQATRDAYQALLMTPAPRADGAAA